MPGALPTAMAAARWGSRELGHGRSVGVAVAAATVRGISNGDGCHPHRLRDPAAAGRDIAPARLGDHFWRNILLAPLGYVLWIVHALWVIVRR